MSSLFGSIFSSSAAMDAAAIAQQRQMEVAAFQNQVNAVKMHPFGFAISHAVGLKDATNNLPENGLSGMDAVQSLAYDPDRWPHCIDIEAANGPD